MVLYSVLAAIVFYFAGKSLIHTMKQVAWHKVHFRFWPVAAAMACMMAIRVCNALACRTLLLSMGNRVGHRWTAGTIWVSSLGKYVPGKMVAGLSAAVMLTRRGVELPTALAVMFLYTLMMLHIGVIFAAPLLLTAPLHQRYPTLGIIALVLIAVGMVALHPRVFILLCNQTLRWLRRGRLYSTPTSGAYLATVGILLVRAVLMGGCAWLVAISFTSVGLRDLPVVVAGTALATVAGFLAFFVPAGLGVQELGFMGALEPRLGAAAAVLSTCWQAPRGWSFCNRALPARGKRCASGRRRRRKPPSRRFCPGRATTPPPSKFLWPPSARCC
jgi:hypothetical protein